ncbi:MAG: tail fiber protein [Hyphomicrobiales bacterium]|nr:tail fiber protein [Hyphomicrobiales bacterium]
MPGASSSARAEPFLGQIMMTANNFCPRGWIEANGQLIAISQNTALFSLYGTMYGGDGRTTFGLPDLRGRVPIHKGDGPGLTPRQQGSRGGVEEVTAAAGSSQVAAGLPYLTVTYCVAFVGIFPSRN